MTARIVIVHDDSDLTQQVVSALRDTGHDVAAFIDPLVALGALDDAERVEVLVTRVTFPKGRSNGVSLAMMARVRRPGVKVLFAEFEEDREHVDGLGEFLPLPVTATTVVEAVSRSLAET
jgi:DNA-binding NtrC family response regulator